MWPILNYRELRGASQAEPRTLPVWGLVIVSLDGPVDNSLVGRARGMGNGAVLGQSRRGFV